jgi:hypothetical protein
MHDVVAAPMNLMRPCEIDVSGVQDFRGIARAPLDLTADDEADLESIAMRVRTEMVVVRAFETSPANFQLVQKA